MKHVRLPSGAVLNLASVLLFVEDGNGGVVASLGPGPDDSIEFVGDSAAMLREWMAKRPLLVPPARGGKKP